MYHIKITDLDDNRTVIDTDTNIILCSVHSIEKGGTEQLICVNDCNAVSYAEVLFTLKEIIKQITKRHPELITLMTLAEAMTITENKNDKID